jgi:hypothetical protein
MTENAKVAWISCSIIGLCFLGACIEPWLKSVLGVS